MASTGVSRIEGIDPYVADKAPCKVCTTANITLSGAQTINGVSVTETTPKTRALVRSQTDATENGIYDVYDTSWVRSDDFNGPRDVVEGTMVYVQTGGTTFPGSLWKLTTTGTVTFGTSNINFSLVSSLSTTQPILFDTIAEATASTSIAAGSVILVKEYASGRGIINAIYDVVAAGTGTDDGGEYHDSDSAGLFQLRLRINREIYPELWGASANGTYECGAELQTAITWCEDNDKALYLRNGRYINSTTALVSLDRITIVGQNKENTQIVWQGGASIVLWQKALFAGGDDPEESYFAHFSIINEGSATIGMRVDASYTTLDHVRIYTASGQTDFSTCNLQTDPSVNVNQLMLNNVEVRSDASPGGAIGADISRGANIVINGGYYGNFETCLKLGSQDFVTNCEIGGGALIETFPDPFNSDTAIGIHVVNAAALSVISARCEHSRTNQRAFKIEIWRGGCIRGISFSGQGAATAAIQFAATTENASGIEIDSNSFQSVGSGSTNPIEITGTAYNITGATQANPVVITATAHGHSNGDEVTIESVGGMTEINNRKFIVANSAANTFELQGIDGTAFTAYTSGGTSTKYHDPNFNLGQNKYRSTGSRPGVAYDLRDQDATPSVGPGNVFKTNNTAATTITDLDGVGVEEHKSVLLVVGDANTTVDFTGTALRGNGGVDWSPSSDDSMWCTHIDGVWYCQISG